MVKIIFVCTGNTCRSPMAEVLAKETFAKYQIDAQISSRGISVYCPVEASENAIKAVERYGLDLTKHLARPISATDLEDADLVLTMTEGHKMALLHTCQDCGANLYTIKEFATGRPGDVSDPFGQPLMVYEICAAELKTYIERIAEAMAQKMSQGNV